jgi:hypothetical protein
MNHEGKHYIHTTKAWYYADWAPQEWQDEIRFFTEGSGAMYMRWYARPNLTSRLEVNIGEMYALTTQTELLSTLAHIAVSGEKMAPDDFREILEECGFVDSTPLTQKGHPNEETQS